MRCLLSLLVVGLGEIFLQCPDERNAAIGIPYFAKARHLVALSETDGASQINTNPTARIRHGYFT